MSGVVPRKKMNTESVKVYLASLLGFGAPSTNFFVESGEPLLRVLVLAGQFGVALATIVYISFKCRQLSRQKSSDKSAKRK
jgi:hypothetical protein